MATLEFSEQEIGEHSRGNAEALWLAVISYFTAKGSSLEAFVDNTGVLYAHLWDAATGEKAVDAARAAVLNWVSCGAKQVSFEGDDSRAEAVLDFPADEMMTLFNVRPEDVHKVNEVFIPIAKKLGLKFSWESKGSQFKFVFAK